MKKLLFVSLVIVLSMSLFAESVDEIIKKAHLNSYYQGNDGKAQMLMKVYAKGKDKPIKKLFYMLRLDIEEGGPQMFFTYFVKPSDIKRTTFLVHKYIDKDDFRRLYIPASDKVIPIAGSRKQDPFMGSDFTYEDVSGRYYTKDNHKLLKSETLDGHDCHVTESIP
ncbi:MAG: outer membrane lipoprotein-sorting protein, partial [bacterium]|nr:outer membrane lipoprotein-sorting protein [bacterium]